MRTGSEVDDGGGYWPNHLVRESPLESTAVSIVHERDGEKACTYF